MRLGMVLMNMNQVLAHHSNLIRNVTMMRIGFGRCHFPYLLFENRSRWRERAEWRESNKEWLRYSQDIAMKMLDRMDELGLTQKSLAERMGCSQQYVSKVLKGTENLSIETIYKIETALDLQILEPVYITR